MQHQPKVSANFRKKTSDTIQAIIVFIIVYILLVLFGIALTVASAYAGIMVIVFKPMWITLMVGAGLIIMGLLVLIFLIKFIFHKSKTDVSSLLLITEKDAPELFSIINEVAAEVGTKKPKKVYLSTEVNAYVFYDSSFWSMFLPIKKNLTIGLSLMNSLTITEFKSILAHEFGHFSQRSMKVGSYTYNVNKVIYNMLYENDSYNLLKQQIAGWNSFVVFFANIATSIVGVIQKILQSLYKDINVNYMALSREMEFHADEVAASITGSKPMIASLLRLDIAEESYQAVLNYYNGKINESVKTNHLFPRQRFVLEQLGNDGQHSFSNGLPVIKKEDIIRYNKSKLVITDQWASHPSIFDRVSALEALDLPTIAYDQSPAISLIPEILEEKTTEHLFQTVTYENTPVLDTIDDFKKGFIENKTNTQFPKLFDGFYNAKNPGLIDTNTIAPEKRSIDTLFSSEMKDKIYTAYSLTNDINILRQISQGSTDITSFDYAGEKYKATEAKQVLETIEVELQTVLDQLKVNDEHVYAHFLWLETQAGGTGKLKMLYDEFILLDKEYDEMVELYNKMEEGVSFIQYSTPLDEINQRLDILKKNAELNFRETIKKLLDRTSYTAILTQEEKDQLMQYTSREPNYFDGKEYNNDELQILFGVMGIFRSIISRAYYQHKKDMLNYFVQLHESSVAA